MVKLVGVAVLLGMGCYNPSIAPGGRCSAQRTCPADLVCDPVLDICTDNPGTVMHDAAVVVIDAPPDAMPDAAIPAPAVRSHSIVDGTTTTTMITVPAGTQTGDLLLAHVSCDAASPANITVPAGWTKIIERDGLENQHYAGLFYRYADAATTSYTWTFPNMYNSVALIAITDADLTMPVDVVDAVTIPSTMPPVAPSITTTQPRTLNLALFTEDLGDGPFTAITGMTEVYAYFTGNLYLYAASAEMPAAGPTGTRASTTAQPGPVIAFSIAIAPR